MVAKLQMKLKCKCGFLEAKAEVRMLIFKKKKKVKLVYSNIEGEFIIAEREDMLMCPTCMTEATGNLYDE
jgi:hypothetical protein